MFPFILFIPSLLFGLGNLNKNLGSLPLLSLICLLNLFSWYNGRGLLRFFSASSISWLYIWSAFKFSAIIALHLGQVYNLFAEKLLKLILFGIWGGLGKLLFIWFPNFNVLKLLLGELKL